MDVEIEKTSPAPSSSQRPSPKALEELWEYVRWEAARREREFERQELAMRIRAHCLSILDDVRFSDDEALTRVRRLLR